MKLDTDASPFSAVITGGGSGLGSATARRLHALGASIVIADLPGSPGQQLADELGDRVRFVPADVRSSDELAAAVAAATELGALRVAVACAGVATPGRILGRKGVLPLETYRSVIEINLVGTFNLLRLAAEAMAGNEPLDGDRGVILMTASIAAFDGQVGQAAYASSKAGVSGLTLPAARDLADKNIRVVTIAPGTFETPMMAGLPQETKDSLGAMVPHPARLGYPDEYAMLAEHIVANPMLNGETIRLDGALRMPPR
ncbi:NAD(P)-dependent dehydrogenase (short-subunit alcohol dehydrogenase family) [Kineosphaera limosa]|uniref:Putative 3-hydroxyacyl-CoA dehydrogenase n=1 Tax=Kineosphaera limosa NBRC 100340 TaxID=1184609 RepID=K6WEX6_9MICO|nr:SDR family NAD(P)-dependent oxidoreductase [Kineosphaera limosa]NYD98968.1 NAD(P)-dependent dehydrogenase (short-subunit alcohol dehydrogenase family) [Kineosphaera limosa]GAB97810.1 putative 3-hydroxyacyl-CoA dehydrogenase [Kineosphaera limosa NBRC 100340]